MFVESVDIFFFTIIFLSAEIRTIAASCYLLLFFCVHGDLTEHQTVLKGKMRLKKILISIISIIFIDQFRFATIIHHKPAHFFNILTYRSLRPFTVFPEVSVNSVQQKRKTENIWFLPKKIQLTKKS